MNAWCRYLVSFWKEHEKGLTIPTSDRVGLGLYIGHAYTRRFISHLCGPFLPCGPGTNRCVETESKPSPSIPVIVAATPFFVPLNDNSEGES